MKNISQKQRSPLLRSRCKPITWEIEGVSVSSKSARCCLRSRLQISRKAARRLVCIVCPVSAVQMEVLRVHFYDNRVFWIEYDAFGESWLREEKGSCSGWMKDPMMRLRESLQVKQGRVLCPPMRRAGITPAPTGPIQGIKHDHGLFQGTTFRLASSNKKAPKRFPVTASRGLAGQGQGFRAR